MLLQRDGRADIPLPSQLVGMIKRNQRCGDTFLPVMQKNGGKQFAVEQNNETVERQEANAIRNGRGEEDVPKGN